MDLENKTAFLPIVFQDIVIFTQVILGIMVPPSIYWLDFKTKRELSLLPVTVREHQHDMVESDSSSSAEEGSEEEEVEKFLGVKKRPFRSRRRTRTRHESKIKAR